MGVYFLPFSITKQLEVVQLLQKVLFLSREQKKFLFDTESNLKLRIHLSEYEKQKLREILRKFGYRIELS
jgi:hypothetical protein